MQQHGSRWDETPSFGAGYSSPGWKRAQASGYRGSHPARQGVIEGEGRLIAVSESSAASAYTRGDRVFHVKFGYGKVTAVEGNKLTVNFEQAGEKKVIDSFVEKQ
jgi:DNA helicase II / ATP-dependent DNA helicase PcrA